MMARSSISEYERLEYEELFPYMNAVGVMILDGSRTRIVFANEKCQRILGGNAIGARVDGFIAPGQDHPHCDKSSEPELVANVISTTQGVVKAIDYQNRVFELFIFGRLRFVKKNGQVRWGAMMWPIDGEKMLSPRTHQFEQSSMQIKSSFSLSNFLFPKEKWNSDRSIIVRSLHRLIEIIENRLRVY